MSARKVGVKICGLSTIETLDATLEAGGDYVGLVFYPKSPRHVSLAAAHRLANHARGRAQIVALTVNASDAELTALVAEVAPDLIQLHGAETPERTAYVARFTKRPVMKAITVATRADAMRALDYKLAADLVLFDAKPPATANALPGGNGHAFDWQLIDQVKDEVAYMLSGGLTPANVADAIRQTGAYTVDVSSGVESAPGVKDLGLIRAFIHAAKAVG
jgi:phosphoribosylanthranilate isomerase